MVRARHSQRGVVLIVVLAMVALLTVILVEFAYESRIGLHIADNDYRSTQALNCADAGISIASVLLREYDARDETKADIRQMLSGSTKIRVGAGYCTLSFEEEAGKININAFRTRTGGIEADRVKQLLRLIYHMNQDRKDREPISYSLVAAMIDWVDADDAPTLLPSIERENKGAEKDYYESLPRPYTCKNAPYDTLDEVVLVKGMTRELFEGERGDPEPGRPKRDGMRRYLTIYGDGKIDINHAPPRVIQSLSEQIDDALARKIIEYRNARPFTRVSDILEVEGMTREIYSLIRRCITTSPNPRYYRVTATGVAEDFTRRVQVVMRKSSDRVHVVLREEL